MPTVGTLIFYQGGLRVYGLRLAALSAAPYVLQLYDFYTRIDVQVHRNCNLSGESGLNASRFDDLFKNSTELPHLALTALDNVVFIDDLSGSGNQVCNNWNTIKELMGSNSKTYLILSAATQTAKDRIGSETDAILIASHNLGDDDNVFSYKCKFFNSMEKITLLRYCRKADGINPKGFGNCGLLFVLSHKTPNNTLPILHANHPKWRGLFPRYL